MCGQNALLRLFYHSLSASSTTTTTCTRGSSRREPRRERRCSSVQVHVRMACRWDAADRAGSTSPGPSSGLASPPPTRNAPLPRGVEDVQADHHHQPRATAGQHPGPAPPLGGLLPQDERSEARREAGDAPRATGARDPRGVPDHRASAQATAPREHLPTDLRHAASAIGLPGLHPHRLRHIAASLAIAAGVRGPAPRGRRWDGRRPRGGSATPKRRSGPSQRFR